MSAQHPRPSAPAAARRLSDVILLAAVAVLLLPAASTPQTALGAKWFRFVPEVIRQDATGPVRLEVAAKDVSSRVVFVYAPGATSPSGRGIATYDLRDDGDGGDTLAGDGIFTVTLQASKLVGGLTEDDVFHRIVGFLYFYRGTEAAGPWQVQAPVINNEIPPVTVRRLASDVQASRHVVNIVDPEFQAIGDNGRAYRRFYDFFDDDYFGINVVTLPSRFENRYGGPLQSDATGTGSITGGLNPMMGSGGGLFHVSAFPLLGYFDGAETGVNHELGHQWVNFLRAVPALSTGAPHWPVSSLAGGVMGWSASGGEGLDFRCLVTEESGALRMRPRTTQAEFTDFDLYLMGLLPADQVGDAFVLPNSTTGGLACNGGLYTGAFQRVRIQDVIAAVGERVPAAGQARTRFRIATIVVSQDGLLDDDAMAYIDYFAARMELTEETLIHSGYLKATGKPFAVATRGLGSIDATVTPRTVRDFSMTVSPRQLSIIANQPARFTIHLAPTSDGFTSPVSFECLASVGMRACTFDPPVAIPGTSGTDVVMTVPSNTTWQTGYKWVVRASAGNLRHSTDVVLNAR